ncbi:hypothetical protein [Spongiactinospora gelatinilytica]|uniref:hypothetical protein n=1 Tax=Spongiactinospora gelatinilytica TaxID=2666298 RepID=UPI001F393B1B|nr:hypothetical protein [Spongiactinospora gelatinilytica]
MMTATMVAGCVLFALGCGTDRGPGTDSATPTDKTVTQTVTTTPSIPGPGSPQPVEPKGDTIDPRPVPWISATPEAGGERLRLVWWSGVEPCRTLDRVEVDESAAEVKVTIYEGPARDAQNVACIEIAVQKTTTVTLKAPLGDRKVVDGAS